MHMWMLHLLSPRSADPILLSWSSVKPIQAKWGRVGGIALARGATKGRFWS